MNRKVLFLCTGNSIRSQMAEAFMKVLSHGEVDAVSAGVSPSRIHPLTYLMMEEEGINISKHYSKGLDGVAMDDIDFVITLCDHARDRCPKSLIERPHEHWSISDPIAMKLSEATQIARFRETKADIKARIEDWLRRFERS